MALCSILRWSSSWFWFVSWKLFSWMLYPNWKIWTWRLFCDYECFSALCCQWGAICCTVDFSYYPNLFIVWRSLHRLSSTRNYSWISLSSLSSSKAETTWTCFDFCCSDGFEAFLKPWSRWWVCPYWLWWSEVVDGWFWSRLGITWHSVWLWVNTFPYLIVVVFHRLIDRVYFYSCSLSSIICPYSEQSHRICRTLGSSLQWSPSTARIGCSSAGSAASSAIRTSSSPSWPLPRRCVSAYWLIRSPVPQN